MEGIILTTETKESLIKELCEKFKQILDDKQNENLHKKEHLTRKETASFLKVSLVTVYEWSKKGILKPKKIGNRVLFLKSDILEAMQSIEAKKIN